MPIIVMTLIPTMYADRCAPIQAHTRPIPTPCKYFSGAQSSTIVWHWQRSRGRGSLSPRLSSRSPSSDRFSSSGWSATSLSKVPLPEREEPTLDSHALAGEISSPSTFLAADHPPRKRVRHNVSLRLSPHDTLHAEAILQILRFLRTCRVAGRCLTRSKCRPLLRRLT
ncbi:hypothetical protein BD626DRAFT_161622 [Schizophyllum amplum]|uniref:Uncharacterized protein n=1 Tax=Schizophyllum amplum TaxID=97359 RepID=A0A550CPA6_9AGAR|nr:hypothetical protein BD626DRAFT_161622 [Auriculariopsis ampla]